MKPILFNTEMVRAILDGRKTVTRRVVKLPKNIKEQPDGMYTINTEGDCYEDCYLDGLYADGYLLPKYKVGDILYVRETWNICNMHIDADENAEYNSITFIYKTGKDESETANTVNVTTELYDKYDRSMAENNPEWRSSATMPKSAARIFLKVTDIRVERLQDITEEQAIKEGFTDNRGFIHSPQDEYDNIHSAKQGFYSLWDSTVKDDSQKWESNLWVWVIEFKRCEKPEGWC